jgi:hypothetical protein
MASAAENLRREGLSAPTLNRMARGTHGIDAPASDVHALASFLTND